MKGKWIKLLGLSVIASFVLLTSTITIFANTNLPANSFGANENAMHFNFSAPSSAGAEATGVHFNIAVPIDVRTAGMYSQYAGGNAHNYNYGDIIGTLTVERLGRRINVIGGATMRAMDFGSAHFSFTGLNHGNTGLIGHNRGRSNGFFIFVKTLNEGDLLTLEAGGITRTYAVTSVFTVDEADFSPLMQFGDNRLTLVTCVEYVPSLRRVAVAIEVQ